MRIVTHLMGGLGNQLFQYAAVRALSCLNPGAEVYVHFEDHYKVLRRQFALAALPIRADRATKKILRDIGPRRGLTRRLMQLFGLPTEPLVYREKKTFTFDPDVLSIKGDCYLIGFWQSPLYFQQFREVILAEVLPAQLSERGNQWRTRVQQAGVAIMVHFRRTDYSQPGGEFFMLPSSYYQNALQYMIDLYPTAAFFFFSDDPVWLKTNFLASFTRPYHVVSGEGLSETEEMAIMASCHHAIIANSTFSWWGAWAISHPGKCVLYPRQWLSDPARSVEDLIPEDWHPIDV